MKNIVIVGFMGTGKTTTAKILARKLGIEYISIDDIIEQKEGRSISDIFAELGEGHFRETEKRTIKEMSGGSAKVIDAGGGAVLDPDNMKELKTGGVVVCLWASPEVIYERVKNEEHRPLLKVEDPLTRIKELIEKRRPFYEKADLHIDTTDLSLEETTDKIEGMLHDEKII
ncbi:MAG: shikimate kinase [Candidatus Omnitrophota bacterium]|nr:shikimate kinase [Candidatus Omnitrophota bacterium]